MDAADTIAGTDGRRALTIISVPFVRVARSLLSEPVLANIADSDILVVTPFAEDSSFTSEFGRPGITFLRVPAAPPQRQPHATLYALSEIMRMDGFWRRYRNAGLGYYWNTIGVRFVKQGQDERDGLLLTLTRYFCSVFGSWPSSWRCVERLIGKQIYACPELDQLRHRYSTVTLVQASSWGFQDRLLAWHARKNGFRTVLVPYTTDQLWTNGYLLCDYDAVCAQGPFEERCARRYHRVPESRLVRLGSIWFRAVDDLIVRAGILSRGVSSPRLRTVLYAGVAPAYFPRDSEFKAVDALLKAASNGVLGPARIVYRPFAIDHADRAELTARYGADARIELQWPEEACAGLQGYSGEQLQPQVVQYLARLSAADVVIMSHTTSLGWDAAYLGCGVVANFADDTGTLARRGTQLRFSSEGELDCAPGLPVARTVEHLIDLVREQLADPRALERSRDAVVGEWDFACPNWRTRLQESLRALHSLPA